MGVAGALFAPASLSAESRRFTFEYEATIGPVGAGAGPVDVFVPLAAENAQQRVRSEEIVASIPGAISVEDAYGNRFWHGRIENAGQDLIKVSVRTQVERRITKSREPTESRGLRKEGLGTLRAVSTAQSPSRGRPPHTRADPERDPRARGGRGSGPNRTSDLRLDRRKR